MQQYDRRIFLKYTGLTTATAAAMGSLPHEISWAESPTGLQLIERKPLKKLYRAAVIGSTGHGGYGHRMDRALVGLPNVELVAIADNDANGLQAAGKRNEIDRLYRDYREMLEKEQIDLVSIGTRHPVLHEEMVIQCAKAGKHIYCEKPLAVDLASADRMIEACDRHGVKLAVALPNRASLAIAEAVKMVREGRIGKLLRIRANGKDGRRGGGEDLMVLGYHMLDLMCLFAGDPQWVFAQVLEGDRDSQTTDAHAATEPLGPVAGDSLAAMFGFANQVHGYLESHRGLPGGDERFCLEIRGSKGMIALRSLCDVMWFDGPTLNPVKPLHWQPITTPEWDAIGDNDLWCRQSLVHDLLQAAEENREPFSSGKQTRWVQEMIQGVYASHLTQARVPLPLKQREHPLGTLNE
ncbi:MAG: Gfo/Idh/MocA family oxidoreductase [Planctomycetes bacterium]|nr:Gfo/Idh/MocA family oxidoreductase [Planctomycetota bacterium]